MLKTTGDKSVNELAGELMERISEVCGGKQTKAEINGADVVFVNQRHSCG